MKSLRIILGFIFVALITLLALLMCQPKKAQIEVIDAETGKPIEDATVNIESTDKHLRDVELTTNEDGICDFEYRDEKASLDASVSANGYEPAKSEDVELSYFKNDVLVISLHPLRTAKIHVIDKETLQPIEEAAVKVVAFPYPGDIRLNTNGDGICDFQYASSQTAIDTILAVKAGYSGAIYTNVATSYLADSTLIIPLEKLKGCDSEINNSGLPSHAVQTFYLGDYSEDDDMVFLFKYWTCSFPDHIQIYSGSYQSFLENRAERIFDFTGTTPCNYDDEHMKMLPIKGPNIFVIVDNANDDSPNSTAWGFYIGCPQHR